MTGALHSLNPAMQEIIFRKLDAIPTFQTKYSILSCFTSTPCGMAFSGRVDGGFFHMGERFQVYTYKQAGWGLRADLRKLHTARMGSWDF